MSDSLTKFMHLILSQIPQIWAVTATRSFVLMERNVSKTATGLDACATLFVRSSRTMRYYLIGKARYGGRRNHKNCWFFKQEVCGSDGFTYESECLVRLQSCRDQKPIWVVHKGPCPDSGKKVSPKNICTKTTFYLRRLAKS